MVCHHSTYSDIDAANLDALLTKVENAWLEPNHAADIRGSAIQMANVCKYGIHSEFDPAAIARHARRPLRWAKARGPALVFPGRGIDGKPNGYNVIKPDRPVTAKRKYEAPASEYTRAFFADLATRWIDLGYGYVLITEGIKKAIAAEQCGVPTIALGGVWNWGKDRTLNPDLAEVPWQYLHPVIGFDTDDEIKENVNHAAAELGRILSELGADVRYLRLPRGPRDPKTGRPTKTAVDDLIKRTSTGTFFELFQDTIRRPAFVSLADYRAEMTRRRIYFASRPGYYLDRGPTGSGKSTADLAARETVATSLTALPTHANCEELAEDLNRRNLAAAAYPELNRETCQNYEVASAAIEVGLTPTAAVCHDCPIAGGWRGCEYHMLMATAKEAGHQIATHRRTELSAASIMKGRKFISIHEDLPGILAPTTEASGGFKMVADAAVEAYRKCLRETEDDFAAYFRKMENVANKLAELCRTAEQTAPIDTGTPAHKPRDADARLFEIIRTAGMTINPDAMRIVQNAACGRLTSISVQVDSRFVKGGTRETRRTIVAVMNTAFPAGASVWLNDATADAEEIQALIGHEVHDLTVPASLANVHPVFQIGRDVKKSTSKAVAVAIVRAVLERLPQFSRIGIIADRFFVQPIRGIGKKGPRLEERYRQRVQRVEHFRSGLSRASNTWISECDALVIIGTPRVRPDAVKAHLIRTNNQQAIERAEQFRETPENKWFRQDYWTAKTTSGRRRTIRTPGYRDHDWQDAYRALVVSELRQAIGRARSICEDGIPVVVVTTENIGHNLGITMPDEDPEPISDTDSEALAVVRNLSLKFPKIIYRDFERCAAGEKTPVDTKTVANEISKAVSNTRKTLARLETMRLIQRVGKRGGWIPAEPTAFFRTGTRLV